MNVRKWLLLMLFLLLPCFAWAEQTQVTVTFVGDCTLGCEDKIREQEKSFDSYAKKYGYGYFFDQVRSIVETDDITVANLEGVFLNSSFGEAKKTYHFRGEKDFVNILPASSVEAVNIANNHILDYGSNGAKRTAEVLDEAGQGWFGTLDPVKRTCVIERKGIRFGFVGVMPGYYWDNQKLVEKQMKDLREKDGCAVVIGVMHVGAEYETRREQRQENMARAFLRMGADVVIGHHPHVLQGIDVMDGKTVCYSIGNFVFGGNAQIRAPYTALFQFTFTFDEQGTYLGHQLNIIPALPSGEREYNNYQPVLATGEDAETVIAQIQADTAFPLNPYVEGVGAVQDFVPNPNLQ